MKICSVEENPKETKEITKENPEELLEIARSKNLSIVQVNLLKSIIVNPSVTLQVLSSELGLTVDHTINASNWKRKGLGRSILINFTECIAVAALILV